MRLASGGSTGRALAAALTVLLGLATVTACGDDEPSSSGTTGSSATQVPDTSEAGGTTTASDTSGPDTTDAPIDEVPRIEGEEVIGLHMPLALMPREGDDHLWVAERRGRILRLSVNDDGSLAEAGEPVLDITDQTSMEGERGLLGMAFSPDGNTLYIHHTDADGNTRVARYAIEGDDVDEASREVLFATEQPYDNHNGGHVLVGPAGDLWFGLGDGGDHADPDDRAQDPDDPLGKILRLDLDEPGAEAEIVAIGLRNPWRFSFDADGALWIADVGQGEVEEIDHLPADEIEGANLGWSGYEGSTEFWNGEGRRAPDAIMPVFEYRHDGGNCSITGGFTYEGDAIPALQGAYLFADLCVGRVRAIQLGPDGTLAAEYDLGVDVPQPIGFGTDADGEPYVLSGEGPVVRLVPAA